MQQVVCVWVRDPRIQKNDFWHAYVDYEICLHTDSVCFTKKMSSVRRRYSEFVWLRQKLQANSLLMAQLPELPPKNPFFSMNNAQQISERMSGLQEFLKQILQSPLVLSDSCMHLFLQSDLSVSKIEACAAGRTRFSVTQAVRRCGLRRFHSEEDLQKVLGMCCDSDSDRYCNVTLWGPSPLHKVSRCTESLVTYKHRVLSDYYSYHSLNDTILL
ncbi:putative sorting nexin-10 [Scophthalmus maximus]|uniref:Putative sorting nexin-10 n=1 Tax=Scophthalmus maximus TaxID=52904 RepID=A0A2U9AYP9_SCOMX|nr:putative sorting nexin-10 [Scophthalmus maximus]